MKKSAIHFFKKTSEIPINDPTSFLLYDKRLSRIPHFKKFIQRFKYSLAVESGEGLKTLKSFEKHLLQMMRIWKGSHRASPVYVLGGGSVGDFGGFLASVFKRGLPLVQIPTTWLAAVDSAHGGKTGLNFNQYKNQIGTFYPADNIYLIEEIFAHLSEERLIDSLGEIFKIALIDSEKLWTRVTKVETTSIKKIWALLPELINAKWKIVLQDPDEKKNIRHFLNFGHTVGHVIEAKFHWPHGKCVLYGMAFDMIMSLRQGYLKESEFLRIVSAPIYKQVFDSDEYLKFLSLNNKNLIDGLKVDKKNSGENQIFHTFLIKPGEIKLQKIPLDLIVEEYQRQQKRIANRKNLPS